MMASRGRMGLRWKDGVEVDMMASRGRMGLKWKDGVEEGITGVNLGRSTGRNEVLKPNCCITWQASFSQCL